MININYEEIIQKIIKEARLTREEIENKINAKLKELSDLVSREGAAHIIANELNVKLFDSTPKTLKIEDVISGMRSITLTAKVLSINEPREYKKDLRSGKVVSMLVGDETGAIRIVAWDETQIKQIISLKENDIIKIKNTMCRDNRGFKELHLTKTSQLIVNPKGETIKEVKIKQNLTQKQIKDLKESEYSKILGTVVQLFEPRFYEICPECNKKVSLEESNFICQEHGKINPKSVPVVNLFLDDGTSNIRVVCFRNQAEMLLNLNQDEIVSFKENPEKFEDVKKQVLGEQLIFEGRVVKNQMFDRLELISNNIIRPDPAEIAKVLMQ